MEQYDLLNKLIRDGYESDYLEFKAGQYNKDKHSALIKDIMAMANSHNGGDKYIIIGIKDRPGGSRDILGISQDEFIDASVYQQVIYENIEPEIKFDYFPYEYAGKILGIIKMYKTNKERPYMVRKQNVNLHSGQCWIRKGATNGYATRKDFDIFYSLKERFEVRFMDSYISAVYPKEGCARIIVTMRNYTKLPVVIMGGQFTIYNYEMEEVSRHNVWGFDNKISGADFKLSFTPMEEKLGELFVGFTSSDCVFLGLDEYGHTDEKFIFTLTLFDTNGNEYGDKVDEGVVFAKGDFLWKVQARAKNTNKFF